MNRTHELKIWPQYFRAILSGSKTYEVRINDRCYCLGDTCHLREWDPETQKYTGRDCFVKIIHITNSADWDMIPNHLAIFGIELTAGPISF